MRKSHPAVSSPGLFASPWPTVAARARDNKPQTPGQQTLPGFTSAESPATRSDLRKPGTPLPPNPRRLASHHHLSPFCTSVVPRSCHGRPPAWTICTYCTTTIALSATYADEAPVSTLDVYQIRDCLASNACATQSIARVPASHLAGD